LIVFRIEKTSREWSFSSVIRTSLLCCSCFFFPLVEVGLVEPVVLLATLLVVGTKEAGGKEEEEGEDEDEDEDEEE
jgi:hypothetical protein